MPYSAVVYFVACLCFIAAAILFAKPLRAIFKIIVNSAIWCVIIAAFNFVGGIFGAYMGINAFTAITLGILGIPGFVSLLVLQLLLK